MGRPVDKEQMLSRMTRLCSLREYCMEDLRGKLAALPPEEAEEVLGILLRDGWVDDARYARAFARDKSALQGWGSLKIKLALQRKHIDAKAIEAALAGIDGPAADARMEQLLLAKWKSLSREEDPRRKQAKFFRYALGRGYGYDETKRIYDHLRRD